MSQNDHLLNFDSHQKPQNMNTSSIIHKKMKTTKLLEEILIRMCQKGDFGGH